MLRKTLKEGDLTAILYLGGDEGDMDNPRRFGENAGSMMVWAHRYTVGDDHHGQTHEGYIRSLLTDEGPAVRDKILTYAENNGYLVRKTAPPGTPRDSDDYFDYWDIYQGYRDVDVEGDPEREKDYCFDYLIDEAEIKNLHEYLEASEAYLYFPLFLLDCGSYGNELRTWSRRDEEEPDGLLVMAKEDIVELYGALPLTDFFLKKAERLLQTVLEMYNFWLQGEVYELQIRDESDDIVDSFLSFGYDNFREYVRNYEGPYKDLVQRIDDEGKEEDAA